MEEDVFVNCFSRVSELAAASLNLRNPYKTVYKASYTGILSQIGTKLRDWAVGQAGAGFYS